MNTCEICALNDAQIFILIGGVKVNIVNESYEILTPISKDGLSELQLIEKSARTCYKSEDRIKEDGSSARIMIQNLIKNGHEAMLEHSMLSVLFSVDRGVSHEIVRHRLASFAQSSTRYCNYSNDKFKNEITVIDITNGIARDTKMRDLSIESILKIITEWHEAMDDAECHYMKMIELGATPQIARSVLPNSVKTDLVVTANYREWRNIFKLRTDIAAHPQMREIMISLLLDLKSKLPIIFDDIIIKG